MFGFVAVAAGFVAPCRSFSASTVVESRNVGAFDEVIFANVGKLETDNLALALTGSGDINFGGLDARTLDVRIGGSGDVRYVGDPRVTQTVTGSGSVARVAAR